jgi:lipid II:glycine glycyltransferase (peptidoglycan interpeptide bridge formation enzyme)
MNTIIEIDPLTDERWDPFVAQHPFGWLSHHSGWKRVLDRSFKHMKGHYLAVLNNDQIKAALPLYEVRSWLFGNRLVSIPFATLSDPLVSSNEEMNSLMEEAIILMRTRRTKFIEIRALSSLDLINSKKLSFHPYQKHHYLSVVAQPEALVKQFDRSCVRQKISKAVKNNLCLKECRNEEDLKVFHHLHMLTRRDRQGLPPKPYIYFKSLWEVFSPTKNVSVLLCELDGETIAGVMLLKFKNRVSVEIAAYDIRFLHLNPIHFLFWHSILSAHNEGYEIVDFGSTPPTNKGLMDFKRRWGTSTSDLINYYHPPRASDQVDISESAAYKLIQNVARKTPDPVLLLFGRFLYHHLG